MNQAFWAIHDTVCGWLKANGVDHNRVPIWAVPKIAGGRLTVPVYVVDGRGKMQLGPDGEVARSKVTVPLKVEPPAKLADWLAGKVKP